MLTSAELVALKPGMEGKLVDVEPTESSYASMAVKILLFNKTLSSCISILKMTFFPAMSFILGG